MATILNKCITANQRLVSYLLFLLNRSPKTQKHQGIGAITKVKKPRTLVAQPTPKLSNIRNANIGKAKLMEYLASIIAPEADAP